MLEGILNWLEEVMGNFKSFIVNNYTNPLLWIGLFFLGLLVFALTYNALNKHNQ